ncbi:MAG: tocopherol cyclase family protein [Culicoidibacterales bacterium]
MRIFQPEVFQGDMKHKNYFEGWYIKCVDATQLKSYAFIFGVSLQSTNPHGFIQMIDGQSGVTKYVRFPIADVEFSKKEFAIRIANNYVTTKGMKLNLRFADGGVVQGEITFGKFSRFPVRLTRPGIMGWYRYVPTMECYHGLVSRQHTLKGKLTIAEQEVEFDHGKGYIEKDWGVSMPKAWIWTQSNHEKTRQEANYMLSIADIPWRNRAFNGFLGYIDTGADCYHFATYTGAEIVKLEYALDGIVEIILVDRDHWYQFLLWSEAETGILQAPVHGKMERQIHEAIQAQAVVTIYSRTTKAEIFSGEFRACGFERVGQLSLVQVNE